MFSNKNTNQKKSSPSQKNIKFDIKEKWKKQNFFSFMRNRYETDKKIFILAETKHTGLNIRAHHPAVENNWF